MCIYIYSIIISYHIINSIISCCRRQSRADSIGLLGLVLHVLLLGGGGDLVLLGHLVIIKSICISRIGIMMFTINTHYHYHSLHNDKRCDCYQMYTLYFSDLLVHGRRVGLLLLLLGQVRGEVGLADLGAIMKTIIIIITIRIIIIMIIIIIIILVIILIIIVISIIIIIIIISVYIYIHTYTHNIYIYIYICDNNNNDNNNTYKQTCVCICIYIYIYM